MATEMQRQMVMWELRQSMGEELVASSVYQIRALRAEESGNHPRAIMYRSIAMDEDERYLRFRSAITHEEKGTATHFLEPSDR